MSRLAISRRQLCLVLVALVTGLVLATRQPVQAANSPKILLAYNSKNVAGGKSSDVVALERLLTTAGARIKTMSVDQYRAGTLQRGHYTGVVTLINWAQLRLTNHAFLRDCARFTGMRIHFGPNVTSTEVQGLGASITTLYRQQFILSDQANGVRELLPFSARQQVITHTASGSTTLGKLRRQNGQQSYPLAIIRGRDAVMPYFTSSGVSIMIAEQLLGIMLHSTSNQAPLLTITNVTPYTNLRLLRQLAAYLEQHGIGFAVSVAGVYTNTDLEEMNRYAATLRQVELAGGVVLLHNLAVGDPGASTASRQELRSHMQTITTAFANRGVFPVGLSIEGFWNQDAVLRRDGLGHPSTVVLLPNSQTVVDVDHDGVGRTFKHTYYALPGCTLTATKRGPALAKTQLHFALPTAIMFGMVDSQHGLQKLEHTVGRFVGEWQSPATSWQSKLTEGTTTISYNRGEWQLNGQAQSVTNNDRPNNHRSVSSSRPRTAWYNRFFQWQSELMWVFFGVTLAIMLLFIVIGRHIYRRMYRRKGDGSNHST